jgi:hypothetical protein
MRTYQNLRTNFTDYARTPHKKDTRNPAEVDLSLDNVYPSQINRIQFLWPQGTLGTMGTYIRKVYKNSIYHLLTKNFCLR